MGKDRGVHPWEKKKRKDTGDGIALSPAFEQKQWRLKHSEAAESQPENL